jgi:hypothetical protein
MTDTFRALCAELLADLEYVCSEYNVPLQCAMMKARAALAQPEPQGPRVEVMAQIVYENAMLATAPEHAKPHWPSWNDLPNSDARLHSLNTAEIILARWGRPAIEPTDEELADAFSQGCRDISSSGEPPFLGGARAVLARWGRPAIEPVPVPEEVEGIAEWLNSRGRMADLGTRDWYFRAATLLEQLSVPAPVAAPVPVSDPPGPDDCDAEGRCWFFHTSTIGGNEWFLSQLPKVSEWYRWQSITHWLPHWALPVPGVEGSDA